MVRVLIMILLIDVSVSLAYQMSNNVSRSGSPSASTGEHKNKNITRERPKYTKRSKSGSLPPWGLDHRMPDWPDKDILSEFFDDVCDKPSIVTDNPSTELVCLDRPHDSVLGRCTVNQEIVSLMDVECEYTKHKISTSIQLPDDAQYCFNNAPIQHEIVPRKIQANIVVRSESIGLNDSSCFFYFLVPVLYHYTKVDWKANVDIDFAVTASPQLDPSQSITLNNILALHFAHSIVFDLNLDNFYPDHIEFMKNRFEKLEQLHIIDENYPDLKVPKLYEIPRQLHEMRYSFRDGQNHKYKRIHMAHGHHGSNFKFLVGPIATGQGIHVKDVIVEDITVYEFSDRWQNENQLILHFVHCNPLADFSRILTFKRGKTYENFEDNHLVTQPGMPFRMAFDVLAYEEKRPGILEELAKRFDDTNNMLIVHTNIYSSVLDNRIDCTNWLICPVIRRSEPFRRILDARCNSRQFPGMRVRDFEVSHIRELVCQESPHTGLGTGEKKSTKSDWRTVPEAIESAQHFPILYIMMMLLVLVGLFLLAALVVLAAKRMKEKSTSISPKKERQEVPAKKQSDSGAKLGTKVPLGSGRQSNVNTEENITKLPYMLSVDTTTVRSQGSKGGSLRTTTSLFGSTVDGAKDSNKNL